MATLEKIRSKSVLLLIIIGVALLAFIVGDFFNSGRSLFGPGTTAAKVEDVKVDINDLNNNVNEMSRQAQGRMNVDNGVLQNQVLCNLLAQGLGQKEYEALGLVVTDAELSDAMLGRGKEYANYMLQQTGMQMTVDQFYDMVQNPQAYNITGDNVAAVRQQWAAFEKQVESDLLSRKFITLLGGTLQANELDAKAMYADVNTTYALEYATKPYASLSDTDERFAVSDDEIEAEWKANREYYSLPEEVRAISYINVDIVPSEEDLAAARQNVAEVLEALNTTDNLDILAEKPTFMGERNTVPVSAISDAAVKSFADTAAVGSAAVITDFNNSYVIGKLFSRSSAVDSVLVDMVAVAGTQAKVDSILQMMDANATVDQLKEAGVAGINDSIWLSVHNPQFDALKERLQTVAAGTTFIADSLNEAAGVPATLMRVVRRRAPEPIVDIALVTSQVRPSETTIYGLQDRIQEYLYANTTADKFRENAVAAGFVAPTARVSLSTPQINGLPDSQNVIFWAMKADKGDVSHIFGDEQTGHYIVAAVNDVYDDYIPATDPQVRALITAKLRNDKKAAAIIADLKDKAKDVNGYAQIMGVTPGTASVNFLQGNPHVGGKVLAKAAAAGKGAIVGPMQDDNGVVVVKVVDVTAPARPYNYQQDAAMFNNFRGFNALMQNGLINGILQSSDKVKNNLPEFYNVD